jgi:hypothetical protein
VNVLVIWTKRGITYTEIAEACNVKSASTQCNIMHPFSDHPVPCGDIMIRHPLIILVCGRYEACPTFVSSDHKPIRAAFTIKNPVRSVKKGPKRFTLVVSDIHVSLVGRAAKKKDVPDMYVKLFACPDSAIKYVGSAHTKPTKDKTEFAFPDSITASILCDESDFSKCHLLFARCFFFVSAVRYRSRECDQISDLLSCTEASQSPDLIARLLGRPHTLINLSINDVTVQQAVKDEDKMSKDDRCGSVAVCLADVKPLIPYEMKADKGSPSNLLLNGHVTPACVCIPV